MNLKKIILAIALMAVSAPALSQTVLQSGSITPNHVTIWNSNGTIKDGGTASDSPLTSLGVTANSAANICTSSGRSTAAGRQQLCFGAPLSGPAQISLQNYGTAAPQDLQIVVNGSVVSFANIASTNIAIKQPADLATTGSNITLSGEQVVDGVLTSNSRVLVKDQTTASQNGIYISQAGAWTRAPDFSIDGQVVQGTRVCTTQGALNANSCVAVLTANPIVIGTTSIGFSGITTLIGNLTNIIPFASGANFGTQFLYGSSGAPLAYNASGYQPVSIIAYGNPGSGSGPSPVLVSLNTQAFLVTGSGGGAVGTQGQCELGGTWTTGSGSGCVGVWGNSSSNVGGAIYSHYGAITNSSGAPLTSGTVYEADSFTNVNGMGSLFLYAANSDGTGTVSGTITVNSSGSTVPADAYFFAQSTIAGAHGLDNIILSVQSNSGVGPPLRSGGSMWRAGGYQAGNGLNWPDLTVSGYYANFGNVFLVDGAGSVTASSTVKMIGSEGSQAQWQIAAAGQAWKANLNIGGTWYLNDVTNSKIPLQIAANSTASLSMSGATTTVGGNIAMGGGNISGGSTFTATTFVGAVTGNAATASAWATPRLLAGNSVDGSANVPFSNKFIVQGTADSGLSGAQFLGALGTGIVKNTTTTGVLSIAASGTDYAPATAGSALLLGNGAGGFSSYAGAGACASNGLVTAISAIGGTTCTTNPILTGLTSAGLANFTGVEGSQLALQIGGSGQQWKWNLNAGGQLYLNDVTNSKIPLQFAANAVVALTIGSRFNVSGATGGAATAYVCADSSGNWFTQAGAC